MIQRINEHTMKYRIILPLTGVLTLLITGSVNAQTWVSHGVIVRRPHHPPHGRFHDPAMLRSEQEREKGQKKFAYMSEQLNLSKDQQSRIRKLMHHSRKEARVIQQSNESPANKRIKLNALIGQTDHRIMNLLNPTQQLHYRKYKQEEKEKRKKRAAERREFHEDMHEDGIF